MKKFISLAVTAVLCLAMAIPTLAAIPDGFREVTPEELEAMGFPSEEEANAITEAERSKDKTKAKEERSTDYTDSLPIPPTPIFNQINKKLNINCAKNDVEELTKYLEENVTGFDSNTFKIEMIHNSTPEKNYYTVMYGLQINEFRTQFKVIVDVEDNLTYVTWFDNSDIEKLAATNLDFTKESYKTEIEIAKKEAAKEFNSPDARIDGQEVHKVLDEDLNPYLLVQTTCVDNGGGVYLLNYKYSLK